MVLSCTAKCILFTEAFTNDPIKVATIALQLQVHPEVENCRNNDSNKASYVPRIMRHDKWPTRSYRILHKGKACSASDILHI